MQVIEKFVSINGEGQRAGELAVFVRFKGCNLDCSYCDTRYANCQDAKYQDETPEQIYAYIKSTGVTNVTLTGGEPLLHEGIGELLGLLCKDNLIRVEIETNGSVDITEYAAIENPPSFTLDYKLPGSGMEHMMLVDNYKLLKKSDTVKFVSGSVEDLDRARQIIEEYRLTEKCKVYISPIFGRIKPDKIVEYMVEHGMNEVKLQLQLHKYIWDPNMKGV